MGHLVRVPGLPVISVMGAGALKGAGHDGSFRKAAAVIAAVTLARDGAGCTTMTSGASGLLCAATSAALLISCFGVAIPALCGDVDFGCKAAINALVAIIGTGTSELEQFRNGTGTDPGILWDPSRDSY